MGSITIAGMGPGSDVNPWLLGQDHAGKVILRTAVHPGTEQLLEHNISFSSCDDLYEQGGSFEEIYNRIAERVISSAESGDVLYVVPGSPAVAERTVVILRELCSERGIALTVKPCVSFLDLAYIYLGVDPIDGLRIVDAGDLMALGSAGEYPMIITQVYSRMVASDLKLALMDVLDDEQEIFFLRNLGAADEECRPIKLYELDQQQNIDHLTSVYVPPLETKGVCDNFSVNENILSEENKNEEIVELQPLADVIKVLREPGGCPWDIEQTHASVRSNMIEEVYEFLEAVDAGDTAGMREELGDILMQVVFHSRMAEEAGKFSLQEVIDEVTEKLIRRHPHVFGDTEASCSDEVLRNWEAIKKTEKQERKRVLDGIAKGLPALMRAYKLQSKAAKVGFDWQDRRAVWKKIEEELDELKKALISSDYAAAEKELGDVLFAVVNYARHCKIEPEAALNGANNRFAGRFNHVEDSVAAGRGAWEKYTLAELDLFWREAKAKEQK